MKLNSMLAGTATLLLSAVQANAQVFVWDRHTLGRAMAGIALFGLTGVLVAIVGYKLFDAATPGDLHKEIIENRNTAAAIIGASVVIGVSIIVAAAITH